MQMSIQFLSSLYTMYHCISNSLVSVVQRLKLGQRNSSSAFVSVSVHGPASGAEMPLASVGTGEKLSRFRELKLTESAHSLSSTPAPPQSEKQSLC